MLWLAIPAVIVAIAAGDILYGACQAMYFRQPGNQKVFRDRNSRTFQIIVRMIDGR